MSFGVNNTMSNRGPFGMDFDRQCGFSLLHSSYLKSSSDSVSAARILSNKPRALTRMTKDEPGTKDLCNIGREQIIQTFAENIPAC